MVLRILAAVGVLSAWQPALAGAQSVLLFERDADAGLARSLRVELSVSGLLLDRVPAAIAEPSERAALARARGAAVALWVEEAVEGAPSAVVVVATHTGVTRRAPLTAEASSPRVRALVAASLIDELLEPVAEDGVLLAGPAGPSVPPAPAGASMGTYRLVGELDESSGRSTRPLLSFFGQLLTGPSARVWDGGTNAPWTIRLDAGWADRGDNRLAFATHVQVHAFDGSMATMYLFGLAAGSRVQTGPLALHAGAYILGGAGAVPEHANDENRATLLTGALLGLGLPLERALELVVRGDAGLLLRQRSDANLLFTISLGLEWHA